MPFDELEFERQHFRNMQKLAPELKKRIGVLIKKYADKFRFDMPENGMNLMFQSERLSQTLDNFTNELETELEHIIKTNIYQSWELAHKKSDALIESYAKAFALSDKVKQGLFAGNMFGLRGFIENNRNGLNLSDRVWNVADNFKEGINFYLESGIGTGRSAAEIAKDLQTFLNEPEKLFRRVRDENGNLKLSNPAKAYHPGQGVYRSSYQNALRLAANETNMAYRRADFERRAQIKFILGFNVKTSNAHPRFDMCDSLRGEYPKTFIFIGWHPRCICYTTTILPTREEMKQYFKNGALPEDKFVKDIPQSAKDYVDKNTEMIKAGKSAPYFVRDNFDYNPQRKQYTVKPDLEKVNLYEAKQGQYVSANNVHIPDNVPYEEQLKHIAMQTRFVKNELAFIFTEDGKILRRTGTFKNVSIAPAEGQSFKGAKAIHNHSGNTWFSDDDFYNAIKNEFSELSVTSNNKISTLQFNSLLNPDVFINKYYDWLIDFIDEWDMKIEDYPSFFKKKIIPLLESDFNIKHKEYGY